MTLGQKVGPNDPCSCGSGKKYKKCCFRKRFLFYFPMSHGTGGDRTTDPKVLNCWTEIQDKLENLEVPFDKVYHDSSCETEKLPREGIVLTFSSKIDLSSLDPEWEIIYSIAGMSPGLKYVPCESHALMEEYRGIITELQRKENASELKVEDVAPYNDILYKRDMYVAQRIQEDLRIGEVGLLFLGRNHNQGQPSLEDVPRKDGIEFVLVE